ncbi:hypothetical protein [Methylobacter sp.]|uniref:hypothetical protein n=1 Tax=Methylobacter sp. TaxID=2051955 RepID=UPI00351FA19B
MHLSAAVALLICNNCQEVEERSAPEVMQVLSQEIKQADFIVHSKVIEIHGVCAKCAVTMAEQY